VVKETEYVRHFYNAGIKFQSPLGEVVKETCN